MPDAVEQTAWLPLRDAEIEDPDITTRYLTAIRRTSLTHVQVGSFLLCMLSGWYVLASRFGDQGILWISGCASQLERASGKAARSDPVVQLAKRRMWHYIYRT